MLVFRDVTDERRAEDALHKSEALLSATLHSIGDAVLVTDEQARVTMINRVAEGLTGWSRADAVGRPVDDVFAIVNEDTRARAENPVARILRDGIIVGLANHTALISRDGTERPIADSGAPIRNAAGGTLGAVLVFRDVTEERRAEDALRQSKEKLRRMIASVQDCAIFMLDSQGRVTSWNAGAERIKGYREAEVLGADYSRFFTPEDIASGQPARLLALAAAQGRSENEGWMVRKDTTRFWANVVLNAVHDGTGRLVGFTIITRDLTERRAMEDARVRFAQSREALRLRDEFLSVASHELKTPLTALQLQLQSILRRLGSIDGNLAKKVEKASKASDRLADLIELLLDVSQIATGRLTLSRESFDMVEAVRDVMERVRDGAAQARSPLSIEAHGPIWGTWDRLRVEQIVTNLLSNAIKYAAATPIHVSVARDGDTVVLEVCDRGPGLVESDLPRIFGRFERASTTNYGGLANLGLLEHGGRISSAASFRHVPVSTSRP